MTGIIPNLPAAEYHNHPVGLGRCLFGCRDFITGMLNSESKPIKRLLQRGLLKILKGEKHVHESSKYDGDFQDHRWHFECKKAADSFFRKYGEEEFTAHGCKRGTDEES